jgi:hypothetical protein
MKERLLPLGDLVSRAQLTPPQASDAMAIAIVKMRVGLGTI